MHQSLPDKEPAAFFCGNRSFKKSLLFHTSKGNSRNNVFGQEQVNQDNRNNRHHNHSINLSHIKVHIIRRSEERRVGKECRL